jgi:hypothetical protein
MTRRERLIKFIGNLYASHELERIVFNGYGHHGIWITPDDLTDEALARLASRVSEEFWSYRRMNRQNRERARVSS